MASAKRADTEAFRNEDLVLRVADDVDLAKWDESRYEPFLDALCQTRAYQKEAILTTLRYLLGGRYANLRALAQANFDTSDEIQRRYGTFAAMERALQLPDQLSCSLDLATGTGKSFVLYGIAAILLAEGAADRVLVLCPSNTIEDGLLDKFRDLVANPELRDVLPADAKVRVPTIMNASATITPGSICVENYHAVLEHVGSSIAESLRGEGARTLVLSDEAHHVANENGARVKKWKEFLLNPDYGFAMHVGVSGTCYVDDAYFADVVYRYALRQAMEDRFVKRVEYATDMPTIAEADERWQVAFNKHGDIKRKLARRGIRPLTIVVTHSVPTCERVAEELRDFLQSRAKYSPEAAEAAVLVVTSADRHKPNVARLKSVDSPSSPVEWIVSVSMLTEGWDVKNVFQIVPHEERAFNSKLLIAQVLGRGLRVPDGWTGEPPLVSVLNHDAWSSRIRHLLNEVLELEKRLNSVIDPASPHNFELHTLDYRREQTTTESRKRGEYNLLERGYVDLPTQSESLDVAIEFERAITAERTRFQTRVDFKTYSVEEVAEDMYQKLRAVDEESHLSEDESTWTHYTKKFTRDKCREVVEESLRRAQITSGRATEETRQKILQALGTIHRKAAKRVAYTLNPLQLVTFSTATRQNESCSASELRRKDRILFYTDSSASLLPAPMLDFYKEVITEDGEYDGSAKHIKTACFKVPLNLVITEARPEQRFVRGLTDAQNAVKIDAWFKNTAQRFYAIEYAWKKGTYPKRGEFSPDFFIKQGSTIYVIEVKDDSEVRDPSPENVKKYSFAIAHFDRLNEWLEREKLGTRYQFNFITPKDYEQFFQKLREGSLRGFRSEIDVTLAAAGE